jgi:hypothetical protein
VLKLHWCQDRRTGALEARAGVHEQRACGHEQKKPAPKIGRKPINTPRIVPKFFTENHNGAGELIPRNHWSKWSQTMGNQRNTKIPKKTNPSSWFAPIYDLVRNWCKSFGGKSQLTSLIKAMQQKRIKTT